MFPKNVSLTGSGVYLIALNVLLQLLAYFGIQVDVLPGDMEEYADALSLIIGFVMTLVGQLRRKDLVGGIIRR